MDEYLLIGLGNPGGQYEATRHNIGFVLIDELCKHWRCGQMVEKSQARYCSHRIAGAKVHLVKPLTYMNRSGMAVAHFYRFFKMASERLLVIHDDLDMAPARIKLVRGGGAGGHNGIKSIVDHLPSPDFYRLKIGIGRPGANGVHPDFPVEKYVLSTFDSDQQTAVASRVETIIAGLELFLSGDAARAMTMLNALK